MALAQTTPPLPMASAPRVGDDANVDDARLHFQRGVQFFRDESFDAALAEFERAYEIAPNYRILYNLAQVQAVRHDDASAIRFFQAYLAKGGGEVAPARRAEVDTQLKELSLRVGHVAIDGNVPKADVLVDGEPVGLLPLSAPIAVNAGVRTVVVRRTGYASDSRILTVVGGETSYVHVALAREFAASANPQDSGPTPLVNHTAIWIGVAATAALAATSVTCAVLAQQADSDLGKRLNEFPADQSQIRNDRNREKTFSILADGIGAGAIVAVGLTVYAALSPGRGPDRRSPTIGGLDVRITPAGPGIKLSGAF